MKYWFALVIMLCAAPAWSIDCRVVELPDRSEVVCVGAAEKNPTDSKTQTEQRVEEINAILERLKLEEADISSRIKYEKDKGVLTQLFNEKARNSRDNIFYQNELADLTIKDPVELVRFKQKSEASIIELQRSNQEMNKIAAEPELIDLVKVSEITAVELRRDYAYAYYRIKAEVDNRDDRPHRVSFSVQVRLFEGYVLEPVRFSTILDKKQTKSITEEVAVKTESVAGIKSWDVVNIEVK